MLGWFKKKFRKQTDAAETVETEQQLSADIDEQVVVAMEDEDVFESEDSLLKSDEEESPVFAAAPDEVVVEEAVVFDVHDEADQEETTTAEVQTVEAEQQLSADTNEQIVVAVEDEGVSEPEDSLFELDKEETSAGFLSETVDTEEDVVSAASDVVAEPDSAGADPVVMPAEQTAAVELEPLSAVVDGSQLATAEQGDTADELQEAGIKEADHSYGLEPPGVEEPEADEISVVDPGGLESAHPQAAEDSSDVSTSKTRQVQTRKTLFQRLQERLGKTRDSFVYQLDRLFLGKKEIDQELFEQLEELLITSDLGVGTTLDLLDIARKKVKREQLRDPQSLKSIIRDQILTYIEASEQPAELVMPEEGPFVIMVVGVNGVGKTTTIGKLAAKFIRSGQSVLLVAADTFRAAAINQLKIWGDRVGAEVTARSPGADPSSVVFDGLEYGVARAFDVIIIDTAGRLHTSVNLMAELKKIRRVIDKKMPGAPHEVMLVLDATTGQNGVSQAKLFHEAVGISGLALTKLDGTAKGGIIANVCREMKIPVRFIGIGEQMNDLRDFNAREFVDALFFSQDKV